MCCHEHSLLASILQHVGNIDLVLLLLLTGLIGGFTHCIGMCGPFAVAQSSMRLMQVPHDEMHRTSRLKIALLLPYYLGKSLSHMSILSFFYLLQLFGLSKLPYLNYAAFVILVATAISFIVSGCSGTPTMWNRINKHINLSKIMDFSKVWKLSPNGLEGVLLGFILGFVPCGFIYGIVIYALSSHNILPYKLLAVFAFSVSTCVALFCIAYFGNLILSKYRAAFKIAYFVIMVLNAAVLISYALQLL